MEFEYDEIITHPLERAFPVLRDQLPDLVPFLPSVKSVEVLKRTEEGPGKLYLLNDWRGDVSAAPAVARHFVSQSMASWKDHARWDNEKKIVRWRFEANNLDSLFDCYGENRFFAVNDQSMRINIKGNLEIYPERVPGVPRLLVRKLKPAITRWIIDLIAPNLSQMPGAVQAFLDQQSQ
jgi:hypothetical protein